MDTKQSERTLAQSEWMPAINNRYAHANVSQLNISPSIVTKGKSGTQSNLCLVLNLLRPDSAHNVPLLRVLALPSEATPSISLN